MDELRSLTPESFHLEGPRPSIALAASSMRRTASRPISLSPSSLVDPLRDWFADKAPGESVFPLHHDTGKAIRSDLEAIGVPYETEEGVGRLPRPSSVLRLGTGPFGRSIKEVQQLARHAKPETTMRHYAKVSANDLHGAVESLGVIVQPRTLIATGTDPSATLDATEATAYGSNHILAKGLRRITNGLLNR